MEFWGAILAVIAIIVVFCWESILVDLIAWTWHKWKDRNDQKTKATH